MANESQTLTYENTKAVLEEFANEVIAAFKEGVEFYDAIASHKLLDRITINTADVKGGMMKVSLNLMEYWKFVEAGRKAYGKEGYKGHMPPIKAIEDWIEWKHIIPGNTQRGVPSYAALTPDLGSLDVNKSTNGLAWAIATKIAQNGIKPKPILAPAVEDTLNNFRVRIAEALAKDVGNAFYVVISDMWSGVNLTKDDGVWKDAEVRDIFIL